MLGRAISEAVNNEPVYDEHLISATAAGDMRLFLVCGIVAPWRDSDDGPDTRGKKGDIRAFPAWETKPRRDRYPVADRSDHHRYRRVAVAAQRPGSDHLDPVEQLKQRGDDKQLQGDRDKGLIARVGEF